MLATLGEVCGICEEYGCQKASSDQTNATNARHAAKMIVNKKQKERFRRL